MKSLYYQATLSLDCTNLDFWPRSVPSILLATFSQYGPFSLVNNIYIFSIILVDEVKGIYDLAMKNRKASERWRNLTSTEQQEWIERANARKKEPCNVDEISGTTCKANCKRGTVYMSFLSKVN